MTRPRISIVIPVLNEARDLPVALSALQPARAAGAELIVVDGGSEDDSLALARPLADRVLQAARGRARQMNAGAAASRGRVLLFLHADTALPADGLDALNAEVEGGARWGRFDVRIAGRHPLLPIIAAAMNLRSRLTGIATGDQAIFVRREDFMAVGGFPDQPLMEDVAISRALRRLAAPACLRQRVSTSGRRWESRGVMRTVLLMWRLRAAYFFGADPTRLARVYGYRVDSGIDVAVMAKAPVAGYAKTRLIPALGSAGAARVQRRLTLRTLAVARAAGLGAVTLWCAPDSSHRFFRALARQCGLRLHAQQAGDLGARMAGVFAAGRGPLLLVGNDCPVIEAGHLQRAARALRHADAVFISAEDGGYVLIGLAHPCPELFADMPWSTPQLMDRTRERLRQLGLHWIELGQLWDVDHPADLARWRDANPVGDSGIPLP